VQHGLMFCGAQPFFLIAGFAAATTSPRKRPPLSSDTRATTDYFP
jgi:hypothetical protein